MSFFLPPPPLISGQQQQQSSRTSSINKIPVIRQQYSQINFEECENENSNTTLICSDPPLGSESNPIVLSPDIKHVNFVTCLSSDPTGQIDASISIPSQARDIESKDISDMTLDELAYHLSKPTMNIDGDNNQRLTTTIESIGLKTSTCEPLPPTKRKSFHVIDLYEPSLSKSQSSSSSEDHDEYRRNTKIQKCDQWGWPQSPWSHKRSSTKTATVSASPCRSNTSETSSAVSSCSSDYANDVTIHDVPPGSPDSGLSGSINSNDDKNRLCEEYVNSYGSILFGQTDLSLPYTCTSNSDQYESSIDIGNDKWPTDDDHTITNDVPSSPEMQNEESYQLIQLEDEDEVPSSPEMQNEEPYQLIQLEDESSVSSSPKMQNEEPYQLIQLEDEDDPSSPEMQNEEPYQLIQLEDEDDVTSSPKMRNEVPYQLIQLEDESSVTSSPKIQNEEPYQLIELEDESSVTSSPKMQNEESNQLIQLEDESDVTSSPKIQNEEPNQLIQLEDESDVTSSPKMQNGESNQLIELEDESDVTLTDQNDIEVVQNSSDSDRTIVGENVYDSEDERFLKEVEALVESLPKGFDAVLRTLRHGPEKKDSDNIDQIKKKEETDGNVSRFEFGFDFPMDSSLSEHLSKSGESHSFDWSIKKQGSSPNMQTIVQQMKMNARSKINKVSKKPQTFCCQWHDCDWPGNYEDLAEHLQDVHVELQPFLDSNGKVIKWKKQKSKNNSKEDESMTTDDFDGSSSQTTLDDLETDYEDCLTEDDNQSSSFSNFPRTRRSRRLHSSSSSLFGHSNPSSKKNSRKSDETGKFVCLWRGCKVFGKPSLSRNWIERHVLEHSGPKPYKCIVDECGQRFRTQNQLEKHVNTHFKSSTTTNGLNNQESVNDLKSSMINNKIQAPCNKTEVDPKESCCKCHCHSFSNCDNFDEPSSSTKNAKHRVLDKTNRSLSVDSGISLQSDVSSSSSTPSLSKPTNVEHCHSSCCCLINGSMLDKVKSPPKASSTKNNKTNKKKSYNGAYPDSSTPKIKTVANFDYMDDYMALRMKSELRAREAILAGLNTYSPYKDYILPRSRKTECKKQRRKTKDDEVETTPSEIEKDGGKIVRVFNKKLFDVYKEKDLILKSKPIACRARSDGELFYTLRWHPLGILSDEIVHESQLPKKRQCSVSYSRLPNHINKSFDTLFKPYKEHCNGSRRFSRRPKKSDRVIPNSPIETKSDSTKISDTVDTIDIVDIDPGLLAEKILIKRKLPETDISNDDDQSRKKLHFDL